MAKPNATKLVARLLRSAISEAAKTSLRPPHRQISNRHNRSLETHATPTKQTTAPASNRHTIQHLRNQAHHNSAAPAPTNPTPKNSPCPPDNPISNRVSTQLESPSSLTKQSPDPVSNRGVSVPPGRPDARISHPLAILNTALHTVTTERSSGPADCQTSNRQLARLENTLNSRKTRKLDVF